VVAVSLRFMVMTKHLDAPEHMRSQRRGGV